MIKTTVIGAGPIGLAFALLRANENTPVTLIDQTSAEATQKDPRSLALSYGSIQILKQLGIDFNQLSHANIHQIHISEQGGWGHTQLDSASQNVTQLGAVVRYGDLVTQLNELALKKSSIQFIRPAKVSTVNESDTCINLTVDVNNSTEQTQYEIHCELLVHAEGGIFNTDTHSAPNLKTKNYQQTAIIAEISLANPKVAWAWERFTANGPCALLPASNDGRTFNLVWCVQPSRADELLNMDDDAFIEQLNNDMSHLTGKIIGVKHRASYPLGLKQTPPLRSSCRAIIGNAAQTLHPVAGQGLNLGLRDAFVLQQKLTTHKTISDAIKAFSDSRKIDRALTMGITDNLASGFNELPMLKHARSFAFAFINSQPWLKSKVAEQFMFGSR